MDRTPFEIVDADESHLPGIQAIYNQAVRETFSIWSETETSLDARKVWRRSRLQAGFPVIAAVNATAPSSVLGYASYGVFRDFPGYVNTVEHSVYVDPAAHRQGIGRALLQTLIARAERARLKVIVGGVDANNQGSIALHEQLGFENQGCLKGVGYKFGQPLDLVFMVRQL